ncbi:MAG: CCA tRNA nucleotidyltransferase [Chloroflexi bacterium]|nr:MAG: CCA tRNA nucleotidyltransferase [Chloroflexota bacterium]
MTDSDPNHSINTHLYLNRWIAVVHGRVIGVGTSRAQAERAARQIRPKDKIEVFFVDSAGQLNQRAPLRVAPEQWLTQHHLLQRVVNVLHAQQVDAYLVGGAVRDFLLGRKNIVDLDFAVPVDGVAAARLVADALDAAYYPLDAERGTGRVVFDRPAGSSSTRFYLDFASFRGRDLPTDLRDRDFTINAIALSLTGAPALIDPLNGLRDLENGQIKAVSNGAFRRDPVRVIRAVRQAVDFGFSIESRTAEQITQAADLLPLVSAERQRDELLKLLNTPAPGHAVRQLHRLQILPHILPEVAQMAGVTQSAPHHLDVFEHTLAAMDAWVELNSAGWPDIEETLRPKLPDYLRTLLPGELPVFKLMPLALLLHDTGKPRTRSQTGAAGQRKIQFLGHEKESAEVTRQVAHRLRLSGVARDFLETVVLHHLRPGLLSREPSLSRRAIFRFFQATDRQTFHAGAAVCLHALADHRATFAPGQGHQEEQTLLAVVNRLLAGYFEQRERLIEPPPLLSGRELIRELGLKPGPTIGQLLHRLKEAQATGVVSTRAEALAFVQSDPDFARLQSPDL